LVDPERNEDAISTANQLGQDRAFGAVTDVDWVVAQDRRFVSNVDQRLDGRYVNETHGTRAECNTFVANGKGMTARRRGA
jgi:hypothetical protein